ncbi:hypothetical protein HOLleu_15470 [Holothuria leucospilota]|uniref:Uncharacterized protein n=1 Tax=Holothuria leucospilota TaxID=206669 RepID=A0A9Q1H9L8_HOLLE|nr:hypothetical protein HOLleu_15470 [Holothuria leucospilota]
MGTKHDKLLIILTVLVLIFCFVAFFGVGVYIATTNENGGLDSILRKYETKFSPPTWSYAIWFLIGLWQIAWVVYVFTTICRYTETGPMYRHPPVISKFFMWAILVSLIISCVAFLFLINDWFLMFIIFMLVLWFTLSMAMVYLHIRLDEYWVLLGLKFRGELTCLVLLLQNGVAFYASGTAIFSATAICSGGAHIGQLSETSASSLAVAIFFVLLVGYFVMDVTLWDRYLRFTFSVYPMIVWILLVVTTTNWEPWSTSNGLTLVLLIIAFIMFIVKAIVVIVRQRKGWSLYVEGQLLPL